MTNNSPLVSIAHLCVGYESIEILKNLSLEVGSGRVHALMGPNGSGKSTLAYTLMGHPDYQISSGTILFDGVDIISMPADKRAQLGIFLSFQHPLEIPGLTVFKFLHEAFNARFGVVSDVEQFQKELYAAMDLLRMDHGFAYRHVNVGFSGGEKKRLELLQLLMLKPRLAILDEIDSGLDVDALALVARGIEQARAVNPVMTTILITHYNRMITHIKPDFVHILHNGTLVRSGDVRLAHAVEQRGYDEFITQR